MTDRTVLRRLAATLGVTAAGCVAYGTFIEAHAYQVRRYSLPLLPPGSARLRVLHISDIHLLPRQRRKRDFLVGLGGLEPDLVVNTGDNISSADAVGPLVESLGRLTEVPGVFVFGSNDFKGPRPKNPAAYLWRTTARHAPQEQTMPADDLRAALTGIGWVDLNRSVTELTIGGHRLAFRGTEDAHENRDDYALVAGPADPDTLALGVTHAPYLRLLDAMTADGVQLILAGHTHGGQVRVPGYGALVTNCDLPPEHASGLFQHTSGERTSWVHVSAGIGMSPFAPYRFACPPEVSVIDLVARGAM